MAPELEFGRFLTVKRAYGPSFSPDGQRLSFIADLTGVPQAWTVPIEGGWPEQITFTGDRVGFAAFSPTTDQLIVGTDVGGNELVQLWLVDSHGASMTPLTHAPGAMHPFGDWSPDGRQIAFAANERDGAVLDIYVLDVATGEARRVLETDGMYNVEAWSPDGQRLIVSKTENSSDDNLYEVEIQTGLLRQLTPHGEPALHLGPIYRPDGRAIYLLSDRGGDFLALCQLDCTTLEIRPVFQTDWDVDSFSLAPDGQSIAFTRNVEGFTELAILDLATNAVRPISIPKGVVSRSFVGNWRDALVWSRDSRHLAFSLTTPRTTQDVWVVHVPTGVATQLTHAPAGGIAPEALVEPSLIHYPSFDGRMIPALLYCPLGARPDGTSSAIVHIHGGPESQARPGFDANIQYLANRGHVVLVPNVRGSTGYGKAYSHLDDIEKRMDSVADAKYGADWLVQSGWANSRKIAAMGGSYGGFMVLACVCTYPDVWAAGIDIYGIANFVSFMEKTHPFRLHHREAEYGSLSRNRAFLESISPLSHVDRIAAPLLAVHGENDIRVPIGETEQIVAALRARNIPVEFIRLPNEGHGIVRIENRLRVYPAIADFLDRHVRG